MNQSGKKRGRPATTTSDATHDIHMTPPALAKKLLAALPYKGRLLDPARGDGAFHEQFKLEARACYTLVEWCELTMGRDFMDYKTKVDWAITNPPWSKYREFCLHAYKIADNVCFLVTLNHDFTKARLRDMEEAGFGIREILLCDTPTKPWPQSGFQLAMIWKQRGWSGPTTWKRV